MKTFANHMLTPSQLHRRVWKLSAVCFLLIGCVQLAWAQTSHPQTVSPVYWRERIFMIPYRVNPISNVGNELAKVELLLSHDGVTNWKTLQRAEPDIQGFRYFAPADGNYWFALRTLNHRGKQLESGPVRPQLHIIVDTRKPELAIVATQDSGSMFDNRQEFVLRYEATDDNLRPSSLRVEYQTDNHAWSNLTLGKPDVNQSDRIMGRVRIPIATDLKKIKFRASVVDLAGLRTQENAEINLDRPEIGLRDRHVEGPLLYAPNSARNPPIPKRRSPLSANNTAGRPPLVDPFANKPSNRQPTIAAQSWPAETDRTATVSPNTALPPRDQVAASSQAKTPISNVPPIRNPYLFAQNSNQSRNPSSTDLAPPLLSNQRPSAEGLSTQATTLDMQDSERRLLAAPISNSLADAATRTVNARTFEVEYDLDSVGPWGVSKVELWGTHNNGQTWESYGLDPDNRSPMRVSVPTAGLYGFRIVVDGANGAGSQPPRPGDPPELSVNVDLQPPVAQLHPVEHGRGNLVDHLIIRWTASDNNFEPRPIALFYSAYANGPWSIIASGLENSNHYAWRLERHVPDQFYLRLEARDTAGNITISQSATPVALNRPQPTGRLRGVRPVASQSGATESDRFLTAELGP